jgi:phage terminase small subunit
VKGTFPKLELKGGFNMGKGQLVNEWGLDMDEELFAIEYFTTKNASQSYLKIKPEASYQTALSSGHRLKIKPEVKLYIKHLMDTVKNDRLMTAEEVLVGLSDIGRGDDTKQGRHQKIYAKDKVKALELLAKHYQLLVDVSKMEIEQKVIIVDDMNTGGEEIVE